MVTFGSGCLLSNSSLDVYVFMRTCEIKANALAEHVFDQLSRTVDQVKGECPLLWWLKCMCLTENNANLKSIACAACWEPNRGQCKHQSIVIVHLRRMPSPRVCFQSAYQKLLTKSKAMVAVHSRSYG